MLKSNPFWFHVLHEEIPAYTPPLFPGPTRKTQGTFLSVTPDIQEAISLLALFIRSMEAMDSLSMV